MLFYIAKRIVLAIPVVIAVALVCFMLVHIAPGDPLVSVLPPDASQALAEQMRKAYGFDRPLPVQFGIWVWNALHGNLGTSIATGRSVTEEVVARGRQYAAARHAGEPDRVLLRAAVRHSRRLFPRPLDRQAGHRDLDRGRVDAALLARHGAGDLLLGDLGIAARGRRRSRRLGLGLGAFQIHDPAGGDDVGDPDGHRQPHSARTGRRSAVAGIRAGASLQGPERNPGVPACAEECRADRASR